MKPKTTKITKINKNQWKRYIKEHQAEINLVYIKGLEITKKYFQTNP